MHVLTLTATPIPRTLQLALTGVRDLSLLGDAAGRPAGDPYLHLAVRSAHRSARRCCAKSIAAGRRSTWCREIKDQPDIAEFLRQQVPEVSFVVANGQMPPGELDDIMNNFYDGKFDVLLATTIVESGLDIPNANTLVVHRADHFGLAQLYQIRGRIGRAKQRAYALFTVPPQRKLTDTAERRLTCCSRSKALGAGFQLASHDLDIRGAGNLLGEEQSGHIKRGRLRALPGDAGRGGGGAHATARPTTRMHNEWSPQISLGMPVMIPEHYVPDLQLRMQLYRQLGDLNDAREIDAAGAELIDRFGPLPDEVEALLKVILVKALCRAGQCRKGRGRPQGRGCHPAQQRVPQPGRPRPDGVRSAAWQVRHQARPEAGVRRDWPKPRAASRVRPRSSIENGQAGAQASRSGRAAATAVHGSRSFRKPFPRHVIARFRPLKGARIRGGRESRPIASGTSRNLNESQNRLLARRPDACRARRCPSLGRLRAGRPLRPPPRQRPAAGDGLCLHRTQPGPTPRPPADPEQNWLKVCEPLDDGKKVCVMRQVVVTPNSQFLGSFLLRDDPGQESRLLAVAAVPLGVLLPFGLTWQIDGGKPIRVPFMLCDPSSCATQLVINEAYVNSLKKGGKLTLTAKNRQNKDLVDRPSTSRGFTAVYDGEASADLRRIQPDHVGPKRAASRCCRRSRRSSSAAASRDGSAPADGAAPAAERARRRSKRFWMRYEKGASGRPFRLALADAHAEAEGRSCAAAAAA